MNAPLKFDVSSVARVEPNGFGAVIEHTDFDALVAQPGFVDGLVSLLAKHLVIRIDAPPFDPKSLAAIAARLGPPSVNKGPRLPGFDAIIQFDSAGKPDADPQRDRDAAQILHHDSAGLAEPPAFAIVNTKTLPKEPAWHSWVDMQAVYRELPEATKTKINGLRCIHPSYPEARDRRRAPRPEAAAGGCAREGAGASAGRAQSEQRRADTLSLGPARRENPGHGCGRKPEAARPSSGTSSKPRRTAGVRWCAAMIS